MTDRALVVEGAAEHNLAGVDVTFGPGLTALVGVSGSGKSSLAFDTVYEEARRRMMEALAVGSPWMRVPPAEVRRIDGLGPAVSVAQNVLNRNPNSTVATAVGLHPFLRLLYARFAEVACPHCGTPVRALSREARVAAALAVVAGADEAVDVEVALVRGLAGSHRRLLAGLRKEFDAVTVDGARWRHRDLDPDVAHDIAVLVDRLAPDASPATVRSVLARADGLGSAEVLVGGHALLRAPVCPGCATWVPPLDPSAFSPHPAGNGDDGAGRPDTSSHRVAGLSLDELVARPVDQALAVVEELDLGPAAERVRDEARRRLRPLATLGLGHLALDRPMPTLSRGEAQRVRLAVVLAGRLDDLLHVIDEPTIGLHRQDQERLLEAVAALPGPVLMVEHEATAVALADDVVEIGPGGGPAGGRVVFQGPPAALWRADTASGRGFSAGPGMARERRAPGDERIRVRGASARNLRGVDCEFPVGRLTVVTGPSGAGKTTLVREVLLASLQAGEAVGCDAVDVPGVGTGARAKAPRAIAVDQSPLGNNPRSNPATYTKAFDPIRKLFADATGRDASMFTFNRPDGACPECEGVGAVEVTMPFVAPVWIVCEACGGRRYRPEVLDLRWEGASIADVLDRSVDEAADLFAGHRAIARVLATLQEVGLGYVTLGQPSPSLSGGEAQRVRLARQLTRAKPGDVVLLDEPTTGLHPADLGRLVGVLDRLAAEGCTLVVIEHQPDVVAAADWVVELGPGGGPAGGELTRQGAAGEGAGTGDRSPRPRKAPRRRPRAADVIRVRGARAHNLRDVDVDFRKGAFTVVTGVSGSGKSSLVQDVLGAEATRRLLECLSVYERQSTREGPEAPVASLDGLGPTLVLDGARHEWGPRATVGCASELDRLVATVLARAGDRPCPVCGGPLRRVSPAADVPWRCDDCGTEAEPVEPRHLMGGAANAVCPRCRGLGVERRLVEEKLIRRPDEPICGNCLHSPGYYPRNYLCDQGTGGNGSLVAFAERHGFDPYTTPWQDMSDAARRAFLHGDPEPYPMDGRRKSAVHAGWADGDRWTWRGAVGVNADLGGQYSEAVTCPACEGRRLRAAFLAVTVGGHDRAELFSMPLAGLEEVVEAAAEDTGADRFAAEARATAARRLRFLRSVGLGYLHLDRPTWSLSSGEAQRVKLASVLGGGLVAMTLVLDEPSRGLHPSEVAALAGTLRELTDAGNTVVAVEHDPVFVGAADDVVEVGPGPGRHGGRIVAPGTADADAAAARAAGSHAGGPAGRPRREPTGWMTVVGARENNLDGVDVRVPLGVQVGVCGVSGSGKSSLVVDTVGLALAPPKSTTGVAWRDRLEPGAHDTIEGAPARAVVADQARTSVTSAGAYLGIVAALRAEYARSDSAVAAGLGKDDLGQGCDACKGRGSWREPMGFLPAVDQACDACGGTGYRHEVAALRVRGRSLPEAEGLTIEELAAEWDDVAAVARPCRAALRLGLGYLVVRQPGWSLSGGEAQRVKLARELAKRTTEPALYLLDEPTVGLHASDVAVLADTLAAVVDDGHTVLVVEHHPGLLATCDWVIELGPGAGPDGGRVVFSGTPDALASAGTATAPYVAEALA